LSLRQRYLTILTRLAPAGAVGVSLALGAAAPAAANALPSSADKEKVSERLNAVRDAISLVAGTQAEPGKAEPRVAWFGNGGWWGFPNFPNFPNWRDFRNWFRNW